MHHKRPSKATLTLSPFSAESGHDVSLAVVVRADQAQCCSAFRARRFEMRSMVFHFLAPFGQVLFFANGEMTEKIFAESNAPVCILYACASIE